MKRVRAQGCHTLYKSQVILSTKDTPPVPKLCIKSQDNHVLHGPTVIPLLATHLREAVRSVHRPRRGVRLANLDVDLSYTPVAQPFQHLVYQGPSQPGTPHRWSYRKVQDLTFVGGIERDDVPNDPLPLPRGLGHQE